MIPDTMRRRQSTSVVLSLEASHMTTSARLAGSVRSLATVALLGYAGLVILFAFFDWLVPSDPTGFSARSANANLVNVVTMAAPVLAVLLAAYVSPALPLARLAALVALIEYAAVLLFGTLALLAGLPTAFDLPDGRYAFGGALDALGYLLVGVAELVVVAVAALAVWRTYAGRGPAR
jgi:hypothetical protein